MVLIKILDHLFIDKTHTHKSSTRLKSMVAETFLENPDKKPVVNHKNINILDNICKYFK